MGSFSWAQGESVPLPDILIAATAVWLDVPLLAWDGDYARARAVATASTNPHPGADLWKSLHLQRASLGA